MKAGTVNMKKRFQCLETKVERLEMENATEENIKQGPTHEITCKEKISGEIDKDPRVIQENIKIASENEKMPVGKPSAMEKNTSEEMNERHLSEIR